MTQVTPAQPQDPEQAQQGKPQSVQQAKPKISRRVLCAAGIASVLVLAGAGAGLSIGLTAPKPEVKKPNGPNILWMLVDDSTTDKWPESGNQALAGKMPGFTQLKKDGAVFYSHAYSASPLCAPSQVSLLTGMNPGDVGGQHQFAAANMPGKANYRTVPPADVKFFPEIARGWGYWATGAGKLDYQVGEVMPTFYNEITGGFLVDTLSPAVFERIVDPALSRGVPFFAMLNLMDVHQFLTAFARAPPVFITDPDTGKPPADLPFGRMGYGTAASIIFNMTGQPADANGVTWRAKPGIAKNINMEATDILGYRGSIDATKFTHLNRGIPGYLPEDIGVASILAREYDLMRNIDYRIGKFVRMLKAKGVYDNTVIVIFGDHGSATYKGKALMQLQSMHTPLWIKYPATHKLSSHVMSGADGYNEDARLVSLVDVLPTMYSLVDEPPPTYAVGIALEGPHAFKGTRETIYAMVARLSVNWYKSFAAIRKDYYYVKHQITEESINAVANAPWMTPELLADMKQDGTYASRYGLFPQAPLFHRMRWLARKHAEDPAYLDDWKYIVADDAMPPPEFFVDRKTDPWGMDNLVYARQYKVTKGSTLQPWGNYVSRLDMSYAPYSEARLSAAQKAALVEMRAQVRTWVDTQNRYMDWNFNFQNRWLEENTMADVFWPGGVQPVTAEVTQQHSPFWGGIAGKLSLHAPTAGSVIRYSVVSPEERKACNQLPDAMRAKPYKQLSLTNPGFAAEDYTLVSSGKKMRGFVYNKKNGRGRGMQWSWFMGREKDGELFVSEDGTFMELACPTNMNVFVWDSRDAMWNGADYGGRVDASGNWIGAPATLDEVIVGLPYLFGPDRAIVWGSGGTALHQIGFNKPGKPNPKYYAWPDADLVAGPPPAYGTVPGIKSMIWSLDSFNFHTAAQNGEDNQGSLKFTLDFRGLGPSRKETVFVAFHSYDYDECLYWQVGTAATLKPSGTSHVFTQAVRKGYVDSKIRETVYTK